MASQQAGWTIDEYATADVYLFRPGRRIVLLNGVLKKQRKVPAEALKRAKRYQTEIRAMDA